MASSIASKRFFLKLKQLIWNQVFFTYEQKEEFASYFSSSSCNYLFEVNRVHYLSDGLDFAENTIWWWRENLFCIAVIIYHMRYVEHISYLDTLGLILGLHPAKERRRYKVTPSLIGRAQA